MIEDLHSIFERDLDRLVKELSLFGADRALWHERDGISNTAGNLALHICGNLRHFIGHILGQSAYVRNRDDEFQTRDLPLDALLELISKTKVELKHAFRQMKAADLDRVYPLEVFGSPMTIRFFLIHLSGHLNYHLGQINYYRRLKH